MDKVTQQNATNAEESASASEELSAQAEQMKGVVNDLMRFVGGNGNGEKTIALRELPLRPDTKTGKYKALLGLEKQGKGVVFAKANKVGFGQVTPLEAGNFQDFKLICFCKCQTLVSLTANPGVYLLRITCIF